MNFNDYEEVINYAIEKEAEAAAFYKEISQQEEFSGSKQMFLDFSKEELKHKALLEKLQRGEVEKFEPKAIPNLKRSDYLIDIKYEKGMSYPDILLLAMKREEKAFKLYSDLEEKVEAEDISKLFQMLAQEESKHKLALETMYDNHMAKMGD
jgi:rubrerythrin